MPESAGRTLFLHALPSPPCARLARKACRFSLRSLARVGRGTAEHILQAPNPSGDLRAPILAASRTQAGRRAEQRGAAESSGAESAAWTTAPSRVSASPALQ